jgi:hypothetical protein
MSSSVSLKVFIVEIESPFSKMSLVVVSAEVAVKLAELVPVVNGWRLRLIGVVVVLFDRLIGAVVVLFDRLIGAVVVLFDRLIGAGIAFDKLVLEVLPKDSKISSLSTG